MDQVGPKTQLFRLVMSEGQFLKQVDCDVKLVRITPLGDKGVLTNRQEEIIQVAFALGHFDFPRKISSPKLA